MCYERDHWNNYIKKFCPIRSNGFGFRAISYFPTVTIHSTSTSFQLTMIKYTIFDSVYKPNGGGVNGW